MSHRQRMLHRLQSPAMASPGPAVAHGGLWLVLVVICARFAIAADRPIRESVTLPVDSQVSKTLFTVDEYLAERRYGELTTLLIHLADAHGQEMVALPKEPNFQAVRYVNVAQQGQQILSSLPAAGRTIARQQLDPLAKHWYETWQTDRDERQLARILRSAYISRYGDNALWELGEAAWDRGDYARASSYWKQLLPAPTENSLETLRYPDAEFAPAEVEARLILCEIFSRRTEGVHRTLQEFQRQYGDVTGTLAGREGRWADLLSDLLRESASWAVPATDQSLSTFGGASERQRRWTERLDLGPVRWSAEWPVRALPQLATFPPVDRGPLKSFPVIDENRVFVSDGDTIRAWNVVTGEPAWPNDQLDPTVIYPAVPQEHVSLPDRPCVGIPWQTLTVHQGKLLARMGSPVTGPARNIELRDLTHELVCLDIRAGQGRLLWKLAADEIPGVGPPWSFEGTPIVVDSTAFVVLYRRQPEAEFSLLALDAESGQIHWRRPICSARPHVDDALNRVSHLLLTSGDGRLYFNTDQGSILALSPDDGRVLWAVNYESQPSESAHGVPSHLQSGLLPPLFDQGRVLVAANDCRWLFCLESASGQIVWQKRVPEQLRHLIGVSHGRLIASGNSLWAFDIADGGVGWRMLQTESPEQGYGHGILTGSSVFWPTREWLYQLDQATGEVERKIPLQAEDSPHSGGNLALAQGLLLIVEPNRIAAYGQYSLLKEQLNIELSRRPGDPAILSRLMDVEASADEWEAAATAGRAAWQHRESLTAAQIAALHMRLVAVLLGLVESNPTATHLRQADAMYHELSVVASPPPERGRLLWGWSRLDLLRQQPAQAARRLHELWELTTATRWEIDGEPADLVVRQELNRLLDEYGREPFRDLDQDAARQVSAAIASADVNRVRRVLRSYPLLESASQVWPQLIQQQRARGDWAAVWPLFEEWLAATDSVTQRADIHQQQAESLQQAGYLHSAARRRHRLDQTSPTADATPWHYLSRGWHASLVANERVLQPRGSPPSDESACLLVAGQTLAALDRGTGRERWRQSLDVIPLWSGYGETDLLIAAREELSARSLETGDVLWRRRWQTNSASADQLAERLTLSAERVTMFDPASGLTCISSVTGNVLWECRPPRGKLQPQWRSGPDQIVLQTLEPAEFWFVDADAGHIERSTAGVNQPWRSSPIDLGKQRFGFVTTDRHVHAWLSPPERIWKYPGGISQAHADPFLIGDGGRLAVLIDGTSLVGLDPATGHRLWATGLADFPVIRPAEQTAQVQGFIAAAWETTLRAVDLSDGKPRWEFTSLPAGVGEWSVRGWRDHVVATGTIAASSPRTVLMLFDSQHGQPRLSLEHPCSASGGTWHQDDAGALLVLPESVVAWKLLEQRGGTKLGIQR